MISRMMKLSGRGGYWSPERLNCQAEMVSDTQDDGTVLLRWVVIPRLMKLSVKVDSGPEG